MDKEKIKEAAYKEYKNTLCTDSPFETECTKALSIQCEKNYINAFTAGTEWGMNHIIHKEPWDEVANYVLENQWQQVRKDGLPPYDNLSGKSNPVLVLRSIKEWFDPEILIYDHIMNCWENQDEDYACNISEYDMWMSIPEIKTKEE